VCGVNPVKAQGSDKFVPRVAQTLDGMRKEDGPVLKKLPVEVDVVEYLVKMAMLPGAMDLAQAVGDLSMIAFYYLLRSVEYTTRTGRDKQTVEFHGKDVVMFGKRKGKLRQLPRNASAREIMNATSATLRLRNQKNGWHGVCINHEANGDEVFCPTKAVGRRILYLREHGGKNWMNLPLSTYWIKGKKKHVTDKDIRAALKGAAEALGYPDRGIPIERIDTHSLRCGGANALSLAGWSDRHIQKLGRWRGETFKEYIREQLSTFSEGMSRSMKKSFGFVNVEGGAYYDVTNTVLGMEYETGAAAA
jgi:hypothetical protein